MKLRIVLIPIAASLLLMSCAPMAVNDFFGIQMNPADKQYFKIASYSEQGGIQYANSPDMNANLAAWAEIDVEQMHFVIINNTGSKLLLNFGVDQYILRSKEGKEYLLDKRDRGEYEQNREIPSGGKVELHLSLPKDFWQSVAMRDQQSTNADYLESFWTGENNMRIVRDDVAEIEIHLGDASLLLKPVPGEK
jgi:hypothetical protein